MIFNSICKEMNADALELPKDRNVKVFMRHSIRFDNPPDGDYSKLTLTPEGIEIARALGASLDREIGRLEASPVERCRQTAQEIARGAGIEEPVVTVDMAYTGGLGTDRAWTEKQIGWYEYFYSLERGITDKTCGFTLDALAGPVVDRIFETGGEPGKLDIICSHDGHVVTLASALFGFKTGLHGEDWCRYTEGIFFYGTREDFTAVWRGEKRRFINWNRREKKMDVVCLDMEGVLVPEIWIAFAEESGIPELKKTTRDEPDYDKLMKWRIGVLKEHGLGLKQIQDTISRIDPLPGAKEFLDALRAEAQVIIISDTFTQFAMPLMKKLGYPTLFCNTLEVAEDGEITGFKMRCEKSKLTTVRALQSMGFDTIAAGDSFNDLAMIRASRAGFLFRSTDQIKKDNPDLQAFDEFDDFLAAIRAELR